MTSGRGQEETALPNHLVAHGVANQLKHWKLNVRRFFFSLFDHGKSEETNYCLSEQEIETLN